MADASAGGQVFVEAAEILCYLNLMNENQKLEDRIKELEAEVELLSKREQVARLEKKVQTLKGSQTSERPVLSKDAEALRWSKWALGASVLSFLLFQVGLVPIAAYGFAAVLLVRYPKSDSQYGDAWKFHNGAVAIASVAVVLYLWHYGHLGDPEDFDNEAFQVSVLCLIGLVALPLIIARIAVASDDSEFEVFMNGLSDEDAKRFENDAIEKGPQFRVSEYKEHLRIGRNDIAEQSLEILKKLFFKQNRTSVLAKYCNQSKQ